MSLIRICESEDFVVDYDKDRGMYRVSVFTDYHFMDEYWFDAYEEKELATKDVVNFTIATAEEGDWQALYTNGKLAAEGHEVRAIDVLDCIADILPNKVDHITVSQDIAEVGMPTYLDEIM